MPEKRTVERARRDLRRGKAPSTAAGEFVREEIEHVREGKHGARSAKQAIAIGLSKARRAGVPLPPPKRGRASSETQKRARRDLARAKHPRPVSAKRSQGVKRALRREGHEAASPRALAYQARTSRGRRAAATKRPTAKNARRASAKTPTRNGTKRSHVRKKTNNPNPARRKK